MKYLWPNMVNSSPSILRNHLSLESALTPNSTTKEQANQGFGGKPKGLWYAFGNDWLDIVRSYDNREKLDVQDFMEEVNDSPFPAYQFSYELELDMSDILVISQPEILKRFVKQYEIPSPHEEPGSYYNRHLLPSGKIDWSRVAAHYKGIEFPEIFGGYHAPWFRGLDVPSGCIWDVSIIQSTHPIALEQIS